MEALQQHASAGGRARLLVLQARLLQRSGAVQSGATSAGEQDPPALLRAALDVAAEVRVMPTCRAWSTSCFSHEG